MTIQTPPKATVFTEIEREQNARRKKALLRLVSDERPLLFVGAGCSALLGYPTWNSLIQILEQEAINCGGKIPPIKPEARSDLVVYASILKEHIRSSTGSYNRYHALIDEVFRPKREFPIDDFHMNLVQSPFSGIVTTNYDVLLEQALSAIHQGRIHDLSLTIPPMNPRYISQFFHSLNSSGIPAHVLHIHGKHDLPNSIVLANDEYISTYGFRVDPKTGQIQDEDPKKLHRKLLWALLATRRIVLVGFGLSDPYLEFLMKLVSEDLWLWNQPHHYAIMPLDLAGKSTIMGFAERLKNGLSIEVVFFENEDGSYQGLRNLIAEMHNTQPLPSPGSSWIDEVNSRMRDLSQSEQRQWR